MKELCVDIARPFPDHWQVWITETCNTYLPAYEAMGNLHALMTVASATINGTAYSAGDVVAAYEYDAFGKTLRESGAYALDNSFRFSTKYHDLETGLVYYGHRYYSPSLGRFINRDPIEEQGGINLYSFVGNNGVNAYDYLGMDAFMTTYTGTDGATIWIEGDGMSGQDHIDANLLMWSNTKGHSTPLYNDFTERRDHENQQWREYFGIPPPMADLSPEEQEALKKDNETLDRIQKKLDEGKKVKVRDSNGTIVVLTPPLLVAPQIV